MFSYSPSSFEIVQFGKCCMRATYAVLVMVPVHHIVVASAGADPALTSVVRFVLVLCVVVVVVVAAAVRGIDARFDRFPDDIDDQSPRFQRPGVSFLHPRLLIRLVVVQQQMQGRFSFDRNTPPFVGLNGKFPPPVRVEAYRKELVFSRLFLRNLCLSAPSPVSFFSLFLFFLFRSCSLGDWCGSSPSLYRHRGGRGNNHDLPTGPPRGLDQVVPDEERHRTDQPPPPFGDGRVWFFVVLGDRRTPPVGFGNTNNTARAGYRRDCLGKNTFFCQPEQRRIPPLLRRRRRFACGRSTTVRGLLRSLVVPFSCPCSFSLIDFDSGFAFFSLGLEQP
mmetsp:Transcript_102205/g.207950  ORF Transcript_102205/g.207950 Transcript_102205/m.207950 type:complete len:334 (+) Transcript_102205:257-1258(+)